LAIFDLYSKRQKQLIGEVADVYIYDSIPKPLRVQIVHIWKDAIGNDSEFFDSNIVHEWYKDIVEILCREFGVFQLADLDQYHGRKYNEELFEFFVQESDIEKVIDTIDLTFQVINSIVRKQSYSSKFSDEAISELNIRFKEHGVGYQFVENEIMRVDSELLHVEAVKPALRLLSQKNYQGAQQEFLSAYEHYRHGKNKEALNDCLKAFESTMKSICDKRGWAFPPNATAKALIDVCFDNELIPKFWQNEFSSIRSMLESGIPTGRNKLSGHGQGYTPQSIPDHLVGYMLHMTASTLVFLTTAEENLG
jgi:hypothetical protein